MGITIHWENKGTITREQKDQCVTIVKNMATEIGFEFIETMENGYLCDTETKFLDGTKETHTIFVGSDWHNGSFPQLRMMSIREGKKEITNHSIMVHPLGTESFELMFIPAKENTFELQYGFCKTQAFHNDNPYNNARSHMWIIATLIEIKEIIPTIEISDESDFYEEDTPFEQMDQNKILESFGENQSLIDRLQKELEEHGFNTEQGQTIVAETKTDESVKSTGTLESKSTYKYTMYEKSHVLYQELLNTKQQLVLRIRIQEEKNNENNNSDEK